MSWNINYKFSNIENNLKTVRFTTKDLKRAHKKFLDCLRSKQMECLSVVRDKSLVKDINEKTKNFSICSDILVVGTGGSSLGSKMLTSILGKQDSKLHYLENVDPETSKKIIGKLRPESTGIIVISKSGETIETISQLFFIMNYFLKDKEITERILIITEKKKSTLKSIQEKLRVPFLEHSKKIGGRFSVFSNVGMLPTKVLGVDIKKILEGGEFVLDQLIDSDPNVFNPTKSALIHSNMINNNFNINIVFTYLDSLFNFAIWTRQLWSESIGKNGIGSTLVHASGTVDQHSQLQLYLDGPKDKFISLIGKSEPLKSEKLNCFIDDKNMSNVLHRKSLGELYFAEMKATYETIKNKNIPTRFIELSSVDERTLGQLIMSYFIETIYTCFILDIDPFNQPAVEEGKLLAIKYLKYV